MYTQSQRQQLLTLANQSIDYGLTAGEIMSFDLQKVEAPLKELRSTFVTIEIKKQLRGCIGALQATMPLAQDVVQHAFMAAFRDPRFPMLNQDERKKIAIHISILNPAVDLPIESEADLIAKLRPRVDGLILEAGGGLRATFLPSVWDSLPNPVDFVQHLKMKAGLPANYWSKKMVAKVYTTEYIE